MRILKTKGRRKSPLFLFLFHQTKTNKTTLKKGVNIMAKNNDRITAIKMGLKIYSPRRK